MTIKDEFSLTLRVRPAAGDDYTITGITKSVLQKGCLNSDAGALYLHDQWGHVFARIGPTSNWEFI